MANLPKFFLLKSISMLGVEAFAFLYKLFFCVNLDLNL